MDNQQLNAMANYSTDNYVDGSRSIKFDDQLCLLKQEHTDRDLNQMQDENWMMEGCTS